MITSKIRKFCCFLSIGGILFLSAGCVPLLLGAAAGAGTVTFVQGEMKKVFNEPIYVMHLAALKALRDMDLIVTNDDIEKHAALIIGSFDDGKKFRVDIRALTEKSSEMKVRVGFFGDRIKSELIMNAIQKKL